MNHLIHCIVGAAALLPLSLGCGARVSVEQAESNHEPLAQGIFGRVTKVVGDYQCCPATAKSFPLSVPVHVIAGTVPYADMGQPPSLGDLPVVISMTSSPDGTYGAGLDPGTYTVFAETDGPSLFLNCISSNGDADIYCATEVKAGVFASVDIEDASEASF